MCSPRCFHVMHFDCWDRRVRPIMEAQERGSKAQMQCLTCGGDGNVRDVWSYDVATFTADRAGDQGQDEDDDEAAPE